MGPPFPLAGKRRGAARGRPKGHGPGLLRRLGGLGPLPLPLRPGPPPGDYLKEALRLAQEALNRLGWPAFAKAQRREFGELFPYIPKPNALQESVPALLEGACTPVLLLVEAPMGMGKTEAALYAHHLLQAGLGHRGLYVALPTQATANGLFPRVRGFLERLGEGSRLELQLQHGTALLNPHYAGLLERAAPRQVGEEEEGGAVASAWFSARKRAMLAPYGVGTLDQALLGVLRVKHHFVRLWGLMNRVVVLDEVHAYDVYTSGLLQALLRWLRALGSSAVVMTATLPPSRRRALRGLGGGGGGGAGPRPLPPGGPGGGGGEGPLPAPGPGGGGGPRGPAGGGRGAPRPEA